MIDARMNFKQQVEHAAAKASVTGRALSRLMPNIGGPKQARRLLLTSVITSIITYGISIWSGVLKDWSRSNQHQGGGEKKKPTALANNLGAIEKGRWTYRLIPCIEKWLNRAHGQVNYYLTQMLTGHGCHRAYLYKYKYEDSPECPSCTGLEEDAEHVFFACQRFEMLRKDLGDVIGVAVTPDNIVEIMLSSEEAWMEVTTFATKVLQALRSEEQRRKKQETSV